MNEVFDINIDLGADLQIIKHIQNQGIQYLIASYNNYFSNNKIEDKLISQYLSTYFEVYLSSDFLNQESDKFNYKDRVHFENFIIQNTNYFDIHFIDSGIINRQLLLNITYIIYSLELNDRIQIYIDNRNNKLFDSNIISYNWTPKLLNKSIVGNIIDSLIVVDDNIPNLENVVFILKEFQVIYKDKFFSWFTQLIENNATKALTIEISKNTNLEEYLFLTKCAYIFTKLYSVNESIMNIDIFEQNFHLMKITTISLIYKLIKLNKNLKIINNNIKLESNSIRWISETTKNRYMNNLYKSRIEDNKKLLKIYEWINSPDILNNWINCVDYMIINYNKLSSSMVENIVIFLNHPIHIKNAKSNLINILKGRRLDNIINFLITVSQESSYIKNPTIRNGIIEILYTSTDRALVWLQYNKFNKFGDIIGTLYKVYLKFNHKISTHEFKLRDYIHSIFIKFIHFCNINKVLIGDIKLGIDMNDLTNILLTNINDYFENLLYSDNLIKTYKKCTNHSLKILTEEKILKEELYIITYSKYINTSFVLLKGLLENNKNNLLCNLNMDKFVNTIQFIINKLFNSKTDFIRSDPCKVIYNEISIYIMEIYIDITSIDEIYKKIALSQHHNIDDMDKFSKHLVNYEDYEKLAIFIDNLKTYKNDTEKFDYPQKFVDPILYIPITEPVILPDSGIFINRSTIYNHLLNTDSDPFNRVKLTREALDSYNNTKEVIEKCTEFLNNKMEWEKENVIT